MFLFELAEHLWLYSGDHVRSSGTRELLVQPGQCNHQHFFGYFGLECVRLWTMGNFSLEFCVRDFFAVPTYMFSYFAWLFLVFLRPAFF